jgi:hypothetical protein
MSFFEGSKSFLGRTGVFRSTGILPVGPTGILPGEYFLGRDTPGETPGCPTGKMPVLQRAVPQTREVL